MMSTTEASPPAPAPAGGGPDAAAFADERILRRIPREILACAAVFAVAALIFNPLASLMVLVGGAVSALAFGTLKTSIARVLSRDRRGALRSGILLYLLRFGLICLAFSLIILLFPRHVLAFAAGFSAVLPVFLVEGIAAYARVKSWKA
jgi:hypothetical protein